MDAFVVPRRVVKISFTFQTNIAVKPDWFEIMAMRSIHVNFLFIPVRYRTLIDSAICGFNLFKIDSRAWDFFLQILISPWNLPRDSNSQLFHGQENVSSSSILAYKSFWHWAKARESNILSPPSSQLLHNNFHHTIFFTTPYKFL